MTVWTPTEKAFALKGESMGARLLKVEYPEPGDSPNWLVLFPDGYFEPVDVRDPSEPREPLSDSEVRAFARLHHPVRFVDNEATAAEYWRKRVYRLPGGSR